MALFCLTEVYFKFILIWIVPADEIALRGEHKLLKLGERLDNELYLNNCHVMFLLVNMFFFLILGIFLHFLGFFCVVKHLFCLNGRPIEKH